MRINRYEFLLCEDWHLYVHNMGKGLLVFPNCHGVVLLRYDFVLKLDLLIQKHTSYIGVFAS